MLNIVNAYRVLQNASYTCFFFFIINDSSYGYLSVDYNI